MYRKIVSLLGDKQNFDVSSECPSSGISGGISPLIYTNTGNGLIFSHIYRAELMVVYYLNKLQFFTFTNVESSETDDQGYYENLHILQCLQ